MKALTLPAVALALPQASILARVMRSALIETLSRASAEGDLNRALAEYAHPHVLVVDEVGYLSYGPDAANVLFHLVSERHLRRRAMVFTTNKSPKAWGRVLHDPDLAEAIVDRILERGRHIRLDGPSIRTKHLEPGELEDTHEPTIISGADRPPYPEPTQRKCSTARASGVHGETVVSSVARTCASASAPDCRVGLPVLHSWPWSSPKWYALTSRIVRRAKHSGRSCA